MTNFRDADHALVEIDGNSVIVNNDHHVTVQDAALTSYVHSLIQQAMDRRGDDELLPEDIPHVLDRYEKEGLAGVMEELNLPPPGSKTFAMDFPVFATIRITARTEHEALQKVKALSQMEVEVKDNAGDFKEIGELSPVATTAGDIYEQLRSKQLTIWEE